ncbi:MAG: HAMP domain-containing histidine kinase [Candidatus Thorarchaeota archaeon]|nr:MAG: HAMP domain-containing histidine kinase [Candidatus Thorarchaeota archaeon]
MLGIIILILHVLIYAGSGIILYSFRSRLSLIPFYMYIGILQVFTSLMSSFYVLDIGYGVEVGGGSIVYAAVIWSVMLIYITERDLPTIKMVILGIVAIQFIFLVLYPTYAFLLSFDGSSNPLAIPSRLFEISFGIFWIGNLLSLFEMVLMVFLLEKLRYSLQRVPAIVNVVIVYILMLILDGLLFPLLAFPIVQSISIVQGLASVVSKLLLGILYGGMLVIASFILDSKYIIERTESGLSFAEMLSLPKTEVIQTWQKAEENQIMVKILLDLLGHDIRNSSDVSLKMLELLKSQCSGTSDVNLEYLSEIEKAQHKTIKLLDNVLALSMIKERSLKTSPVNLLEMFKLARSDVATSYNNVLLKIKGEDSLNISVKGHPLFQSMFYNLLSNMMKYRKPEHDVEVEISVYTDKKSTHILISDHGQGIAPERRSQIFDSLESRPRFMNFGLYIVKTLLNQFGGDILLENRVDSPEDHRAGLTYHLSIPSAEVWDRCGGSR